MQVLNTLFLAADVSQAQGPDLTRYFAVLGGVALVLILLALGLKRLVANQTFGIGRNRKGMQVVEVLSLGARRQMAVVRCYDRTFALGLGEKQVSLIAELDAEMVAHENPQANQAMQAAQPAPSVLKPQTRTVASRLAQVAQKASSVAKAKPQQAAAGDPFESLLEHAQAQLQARRAAEARAAQATPSNPTGPAAGGLQELC